MFVEAIRKASRKHIPRGCRTNYVPGLTEESMSLYEAYKKQYSSNPFADKTIETGNMLINIMAEEKKNKWEELITSTNLTHNSRKAWKTLRKISNDPTAPNTTMFGQRKPSYTPTTHQRPRNNAS